MPQQLLFLEERMKEQIRITGWKLAWMPNAALKECGADPHTPAQAAACGMPVIDAAVPGNVELDWMREGLLEDIYFGKNTLQAQKLENLHWFYFAEFDYEPRAGFDAFLVFEGLDTAAHILLDGAELGFVENMLHAHRFPLKGIAAGHHTLAVHILPAAIYARQFHIPAMCFGLQYNQDAIMLRKPGSMFGWDIMPRIVSAGLWKPVSVEYLPAARIVEPYTYTHALYENNTLAQLYTTLRIETEADTITDYTVTVEGRCGESSFCTEHRAYNASLRISTMLPDPVLWWPKNYGEPAMYDITVTLRCKGAVCDTVSYRLGVRHLWLKRTSRSGEEGDFCFIVNGKRIFAMGTNWVPPDALPSRHDAYTLRDIELADDLGCNMIRCWGGNAYPGEVLYDYCDAHGILIWQDFALACGHYPDDERLCRLMKEEVRRIAIEKRQHPSLALWAGDNECDVFVVNYWEQHYTDEQPPAYIDPNMNKLTRDIIPRELRNHDATRPYLPSSPYLDERAWRYGMPAEDHLWGPRDFFKGDFYLAPECHFASEIGYHGCPSPESLKKFIPAESLPVQDIHEICTNGDWLVHAAGMTDTAEDNPYAYRLPLMISHVERIFGTAAGSLEDFARASQISQAEAKKYFIEHFRAEKGRKNGILWWNVIDGWPQVSDAIVDWYGCKKLAYSYIKRSQQPVCLFCDEPENGGIALLAANESREAVRAEYTVTDLASGEKLAAGAVSLAPDETLRAAILPERHCGFYLIEWQTAAGAGKNHYVCNIGEGWTLDAYTACMKKAGFWDEFEGF